jgi:hypothetical protein
LKQQGFPGNDQQRSDVHGISDIPVQPGNDKVFNRREVQRCTPAQKHKIMGTPEVDPDAKGNRDQAYITHCSDIEPVT